MITSDEGKELLNELIRLSRINETNDFDLHVNIEKLPGREKEYVLLLKQILKNCKSAVEYDSIKYRLTNDALGIALWDMDVVHSDPINPNNTLTWSKEFRQMLGFTEEKEFPNILSSWADRIHPEDKERVLGSFVKHIIDPAATKYNLEHRLMTRSGEYRSFRAVGRTMRNENGTALKVAGALEDITDRVQQQEILESILNTMDSYIYTTDIESDEILFANRKMIADFHLNESTKGDKCWRYFQKSQTGRCAWCKKAALLQHPDRSVIWEENNPISASSLYKIDRMIDWPGGRKVHMQQGFDVTAIKRAQESLLQREKILDTLNQAAIVILSRQDDAFEEAITEGVRLIADIAGLDRMSIFRNVKKPDGLHCSQIYRWTKASGGSVPTLAALADTVYADLIPHGEELLASGESIHGVVSEMPEIQSLQRFGCETVLAVPIVNDGEFWGFVFFENLKKGSSFSAQESDILRSASFMLANVVIRNDESQKLREADEYVKIMLDATPLACRLWSRDVELLKCNEAAVKLFGLKNKQEYLERYFELSPEYQPDGRSTRDKIREVVAEAFETGGCSFEWMHLADDGTPIPAEITMVRVPYKDDYVVASYSRDLREYKKMFAEIERRDKLLQTVNQMADRLLQSEPSHFSETLKQCMEMMTCAVHADRMYISKNYKENGKLYRTQLHEWPETNVSFQGTECVTRLAYDDPEIQAALERGTCVSRLVNDMIPADQKRLAKQGICSLLLVPVFIRSEFWGFVGFDHCRSEKMFSENEEFIMHSGSMLLVNALLRNESMISIREASGQLERALQDAEHANNAKSGFLAHMSHEIRTPLNAVIGLSELMIGEGHLSGEHESNMEKIYGAGATILSIVNDILDISKIESGRFEIDPVLYDTPSLINDVVTLNIVRIGEKPVKFSLVIDEHLPASLFGDDLRVKQIFNNLLSNAFKYTHAGTVEWHLSFERKENSVWLVSRIQDTGIGIKPEGIKNLFTDYNQVDMRTNRSVQGTGLGLAITKRLVDMMGGAITVESEYGKGTTFHVRLSQAFVSDRPIGKEAAQNLMSLRYTLSRRSKNKQRSRSDLSYAHVLIVDDIVTNLDVAKGIMKPYGMKIDCADSGPMAIEMIRRGTPRYRAVFMDHMMPGMDGIEATRIIREEIGTEYARNIPVIALTANAVLGNEEMFLAKGFQAFISKPIDIAKLDSVLRQWVRDKKLEHNASESEGETNAPENIEADPMDALLKIDGLEIQTALDRFGGDESILLGVLRSYWNNTGNLLIQSKEYLDSENFSDYAIVIHGIKGTSYAIGAQVIGQTAEFLEKVSKSGDRDTVKKGHAALEKMIQSLLKDIGNALSTQNK